MTGDFGVLVFDSGMECNVHCACTRCLDICAAVFGPQPGPS